MLGELVERAAARARRRSGREIVVSADGSMVLGRPGALERAVTNLLDNAAKFDASGGAILVDVGGRERRGHATAARGSRGRPAAGLRPVLPERRRPRPPRVRPGPGDRPRRGRGPRRHRVRDRPRGRRRTGGLHGSRPAGLTRPGPRRPGSYRLPTLLQRRLQCPRRIVVAATRPAAAARSPAERPTQEHPMQQATPTRSPPAAIALAGVLALATLVGACSGSSSRHARGVRGVRRRDLGAGRGRRQRGSGRGCLSRRRVRNACPARRRGAPAPRRDPPPPTRTSRTRPSRPRRSSTSGSRPRAAVPSRSSSSSTAARSRAATRPWRAATSRRCWRLATPRRA